MKCFVLAALLVLSFQHTYSQRAPWKRGVPNYSTRNYDTCRYVKSGLLDFSGSSPKEKRADSIANSIEMDSTLNVKQVIDTETVIFDPVYELRIKKVRLYYVSIDYYFNNSGELKKVIYIPYKRTDSCLCPISVFYYHASEPIKAKALDYVTISPDDKYGTYRFNSIVYFTAPGRIKTIDKKDSINTEWLELIFGRFINLGVL